MSTTLPIGATLPDLTLPDQDGVPHSFTDYQGSWTLIYFYPKDDTPGCTKQACAIRDEFPKFEGVTVLGVSPDSSKSHRKFADKYGLPFTLLADEHHAAAEAFGVWGEKSFMGRKYMGVARTSFLVNPEGVVMKTYENVKPVAHAADVLADLVDLRG
jgi:thioredoxin-dependent peroxiredoxin